MTNKNVIGGVSPLKARQASRGGKSAGRATRTSKQRGGFARSKGKRGGGGRNVGGYNVNTSFTPGAAWTPPPSGGTAAVIPNIAQGIIDKGKSGKEQRTLPGEEAKKGNEFADNCYGANGERLTGTSYYSELKGMQIACAWDEDAKDDGSFDYDKEGTDPREQYRTWKQKNKNSAKTFSEWQDLNNE
jgi:hypothetical protein